ncbi:MAG TPA: DUF3828 domain-containing protein [Pyrinomonadaceae bacterium]|jgi:hypothetical protein|nr:DUF3828 domain-containing protein [Pyrinomonadaceae bacterium]
MKYKMARRLTSFVSGLVLAFSLAGASIADGARHKPHSVHTQASTPGAVIKNFYFWYINAVEAGTDPFKKGRTTLEKYVTLRLIKEIERSERDADPFVQTQEWDKAWADTADFSGLRIKGKTATAIVTFDAATHYPRVLMTLIKEGTTWKIDRVRNSPK